MSTTRRRYYTDLWEEAGEGVRRDFRVSKVTGNSVLEGTESRRYATVESNRGKQITVSESHPSWSRRKSAKFSGDLGGDFFTQKSMVTADNAGKQRLYARKEHTFVPNSWADSYYLGPVLSVDPSTVTLGLPVSNHRTRSALEALGSVAIARCKPSNSLADVATGLAELYREGFPKRLSLASWQGRQKPLKSAADEYLNWEFGWKPMMGDVLDILRGAAFAKVALEQLERESASIVRRRYEFPVEEATTSAPVAPADPSITTNGGPLQVVGASRGPVFKDIRTYRKVWFSGAFTFHLPHGFHSQNELIRMGAKADALLGVVPTLETLWNLAPWSWAVDWFSNAGDVISNLSAWASDSLVLKYGYVMEHSSVTHRYYKTEAGRYWPNVFPSPVNASVETKQRFRATPYGFGLSWESFGFRKLSILAALGITRR